MFRYFATFCSHLFCNGGDRNTSQRRLRARSISDCHYYLFPDTLLAKTADEIRERHVERFKEPNLHGRLLHRIVLGNTVIDHETVTRTFPDGPGELDVICIYEISDGKIAKAWFKIGAPRLHT